MQLNRLVLSTTERNTKTNMMVKKIAALSDEPGSIRRVWFSVVDAPGGRGSRTNTCLAVVFKGALCVKGRVPNPGTSDRAVCRQWLPE